MSAIKKYAIIVAGGQGTRMGTSIPKQFLPLMGMPVLCHSILAFAHAFSDMHIILVVPANQVHSVHTIIKSYINTPNIKIVTGGETRFHSVQNGLKAIRNDGIVFVHDGVRPLVSRTLIYKCYEHALDHGSAIPSVAVVDSMRLVNTDGTSDPVDRNGLRIIQTPQTFQTNILLPAFETDYHPAFTDEATVIEASGYNVHLVEGERDNLKITTPGDMIIAETLLKTSL